MQTIINGLLTHYEIENPKANSPILFLPGWAHTSKQWLEFLKKLPTSHFFIVLDLPGFGNTQPLPGNPNVPEYTQFVASFIEKLKLNKPSLFGHSFGGQIALDYANKYPLSHLYLLSPAGIRTQSTNNKLRAFLVKTTKPVTKLLPQKLYYKLLVSIASPDYANASPYQQNLLKNILKYDLSENLSTVKVDTDIIWGSEDKTIPYTGKIYTNTMPNCRLHVLYGAGHSPHLTHPDKLISLLEKAL